MAEDTSNDFDDITFDDDDTSDEEEVDQTTQDAMNILMNAGEARESVKEAYEAIAAGDLAAAQTKLDEADKKILEAHRIQTDHIQGVFRGEPQEYSLLFTHAQDTLMTINSEIVTAKNLYGVFSALIARVQKLEEE